MCVRCVYTYVYMWGVRVCEVYGHACIYVYVCTYMCVYVCDVYVYVGVVCTCVFVYLGMNVWDV